MAFQRNFQKTRIKWYLIYCIYIMDMSETNKHIYFSYYLVYMCFIEMWFLYVPLSPFHETFLLKNLTLPLERSLKKKTDTRQLRFRSRMRTMSFLGKTRVTGSGTVAGPIQLFFLDILDTCEQCSRFPGWLFDIGDDKPTHLIWGLFHKPI